MKPAYYNEIDDFAADWLENLIAAGHIAPGDVDRRSITKVTEDDLHGYRQIHLFAGIGGWSLALRLAGWDDDRAVWTGSCPCQPFSSAGKGRGAADERHLWPEMFRLVRAMRPGIVFGEQVESAIRHGWLDGVFADLEAQDYACRAVVLGAHSVGAPHIRQRLWWLADAGFASCERITGAVPRSQAEVGGENGSEHGHLPERPANGGDDAGRLADANQQRSGGRRIQRPAEGAGSIPGTVIERSEGRSQAHWLGEPNQSRPQGHAGHGDDGDEPGRIDQDTAGPVAETGAWSDYEWLPYADGKLRRSQPSSFPLAAGIPRSVGQMFPELSGVAKDARRNRVGRLRGYGNAIVPQVAAAFIRDYIARTQA